MPAAAVIPAPIAYIKVVAVKTPVVEFQEPFCSLLLGLFGEYVWATGSLICLVPNASCSASGVGFVPSTFTLKKLECSKQAVYSLNILAWNNRIGL